MYSLWAYDNNTSCLNKRFNVCKESTFIILSQMVFHNLALIYFKLCCPPVVLYNVMNRLLPASHKHPEVHYWSLINKMIVKIVIYKYFWYQVMLLLAKKY